MLGLGCNKENKPAFRIFFNPFTISVNPTMSAFESHFFLANVQTNFQNAFDASGANPDSIRYIRPTRGRLSVIFNEEKLNFIKAMSIRICPLGSSNAEVCGMEAFWRDPVPDNTGFTLELNNSNIEDIQDLIRADQVSVQVILEELYQNPNSSFDIQIQLEFGVW
ncbi:MAG: hypothetical protein D6714_03550 [Bacteroidetes bacterium]|nr:MAG: hypothetical protein D6714_03550 [Bacteroidota bacterium]